MSLGEQSFNNLDPTTRGQQWLEQLLQLTGFAAAVQPDIRLETVAPSDPAEAVETEQETQREVCWLTIDHTHLKPAQVQLLLGEGGRVLDAIQYLTNTTLNLSVAQEQQRAYTVELDGYRARRQAELIALAEHAAEQVRQTGKEYEMKDLSSAERRQIHTFLQSFEDLETFSRGREPDRRLVVRPAQGEDDERSQPH